MFGSLARFLGFLVFITSASVRAEPVYVEVDLGNPPFMSAVAGQAVGLYPKIIAEAFQLVGQDVQIVAKPWKRCLMDLDRGHAGVGGIYKNAERLQKYDFSEPLFVEKMAVYFNRTEHFEFTGVPSLFGKRIGVLRGWSYGDEFDQAVREGKVSVEEVNSDAQNFAKLALGRVDVILAIAEVGTALGKDGRYPTITQSEQYLFESPTFLAFNKTTKQRELLATFNRSIDAMAISGKLAQIISAELAP
jgi:polar amino acid transport system substrate-binding protein